MAYDEGYGSYYDQSQSGQTDGYTTSETEAERQARLRREQAEAQGREQASQYPDIYGRPNVGPTPTPTSTTGPVDKAPLPTPSGTTATSGSGPSFDGKNWTGYTRPVGSAGVFTGFDQGKIDNPSGYGDANTSKYAFARYASHYDPRDPDALAKITADMQRDGFPVTFDGKDKIDFGDGYSGIDVLRNWEPGKGGDAWAWQPGGGGLSAQPYNTAGTPGSTVGGGGTAQAQPIDTGGSIDPVHNVGGDTPPGPGWVRTPDGLGWVPPNHPLANQTATKTTSSTQGTYGGLYAPPADAKYSYSGALQGQTSPTYGGFNYQVQKSNLYSPGQFADYTPADMGGVDDASRDAVLNALNTRSMTPEGVAQLKEQGKEQSLSMADQLRDRTMRDAASRGVTSGGATGRSLRDIDTSLADSVLSGNRATDIQKMTQDRKDILDALGAAEAFKAGEGTRAFQTGDMKLRTQLAREEAGQEAGRQGLQQQGLDVDLQRLMGDDAYRAFQSQQEAANFELKRSQIEEDLRRQAAQSGLDVYSADTDRLIQSETMRRLQEALNLQGELGRGELDLEGRKLGESSRQFDKGFGLDERRLAEQMRQFNRQLGFDYAGLLQSGQQYTTNYVKDI